MAVRKDIPLLWKLLIAASGVCAVTFVDAFLVAPVKEVTKRAVFSSGSPTKLFSSTTPIGTAPMLKSLLKKPSKVLTVGVEYYPQPSDDLPEGSLDVLSMKLREQAKVSFISCSDLNTIRLLSKEQETAKGNFPGPIPIICDSESSMILEDLSEAGASAIVIDAGSKDALSIAESASSNDLEIVWRVSTAEEANEVLKSTNQQADIFMLDVRADDDDGMAMIPQIIDVLPKSSMAIGTLHDPMQEDGAEIETGKKLKSLGCASVYVKRACIGDKEDIDYSSFVVGGLTSKASKEFKFSGLTGSTNGHFGGVQARNSIKWERTRLSVKRNDEINHDNE